MSTKVSKPFRDKYKESCFKDAYGVRAEIETTNFIDSDGNWIKVIAKFKTSKNTYGLIEEYNKGVDNSTNSVVLEIDGQTVQCFDKYIDGELALVELIRGK